MCYIMITINNIINCYSKGLDHSRQDKNLKKLNDNCYVSNTCFDNSYYVQSSES